jgi:hypothetical protein
MAFPDLICPSGLRYLLGPRLQQNQNAIPLTDAITPKST